MIDIQHLSKSFDGHEILEDINLTLNKGDMIAITGRSGIGKTTLLRIINRLEAFDAGKFNLMGKRMTRGNGLNLKLRRSMLMVFQKPVLLNTTVEKNLIFGLRIRGIENGKEEVQKALKKVGLLEKAEKRAYSLSGGETQRLALAQFLVLKPKLLLLDEPTANLDKENVRIVEGLIREAHSSGATVLISTHDMMHARRLCSRIFMLEDHRLVSVMNKRSKNGR